MLRRHASAAGTPREIPDPARARARRDGRRLRGLRPADRARGGDQGAAHRRSQRAARRRVAHALSPRSPGRRPTEPSEHRLGLRVRRGGRLEQRPHRHGAGRRPRPKEPVRHRPPVCARRHRPDHERAAQRDAACTRARCGPPRYQAGQHHPARRRQHQSRRFRHRQARYLGAHPARLGARHGLAHVARAADRRCGRPTQRPVLLRRDALPAADRRAGLQRLAGDRDAQGAARATRAALDRRHRLAALARRGGAKGHGQVAGGTLSRRCRVRRGTAHGDRRRRCRSRGLGCRRQRFHGPAAAGYSRIAGVARAVAGSGRRRRWRAAAARGRRGRVCLPEDSVGVGPGGLRRGVGDASRRARQRRTGHVGCGHRARRAGGAGASACRLIGSGIRGRDGAKRGGDRAADVG